MGNRMSPGDAVRVAVLVAVTMAIAGVLTILPPH
jgi:hypothetical protein